MAADDYKHRKKSSDSEESVEKTETTTFIAFFLFGLCHNFPYLLMLSAAHDIMSVGDDPDLAESVDVALNATSDHSQKFMCNRFSTGAILLADVLPALLAKAVVPQFQQYLTYSTRVAFCILSSYASFLLVGLAGQSVTQALCGVVCASLASGCGEATYLALISHFSPTALSAWSCGTGTSSLLASFSYAMLAGLFSPPTATLMLSFVPTITLITFWFILRRPAYLDTSYGHDAALRPLLKSPAVTTAEESKFENDSGGGLTVNKSLASGSSGSSKSEGPESKAEAAAPVTGSGAQTVQCVPTWSERRKIFVQLSPFLCVLFTVYYLEYLINQGFAEMIIFPDSNVDIDAQYRWYQFFFRFGIFVARCSILVVHIHFVYVFPPFQVTNFVLLVTQIFVPYLPSIEFAFLIMFWEGIVGGANYVNVLRRISDESEPCFLEYNLAFVTLADSLGIALAGFTALSIHDPICAYLE